MNNEHAFQTLQEQRKQAVSYMLREITHICTQMKKRAPGSVGEHEAAEYLAERLKQECGCSDVRLETFEEHPAAFYGYFMLSGALDFLIPFLYPVSPILSLAVACLSLFLFVYQYVLYHPVLAPFFPRKTGTNVTATRPCSGEVRQRVLISGHMDAAWEFPINYRFGGIAFEIFSVLALLGVCLSAVISVAGLFGCGWAHTGWLFSFIFIPSYVSVGLTYDPKRIVDGANDNLSGCYTGIALLREMERSGITLDHTEVGVILTGSEEAGLLGARAWAKAHQGEYKDVPTTILCVDTIHTPENLTVNFRDLNGTVPTDTALCELFLQAAREMEVPCTKGMIPLMGGSTDSAAFVQGGFRAASVTGLDHKLEDYYHTRRDTCANMAPEGLENCYAATVRLVELIDVGALGTDR